MGCALELAAVLDIWKCLLLGNHTGRKCRPQEQRDTNLILHYDGNEEEKSGGKLVLNQRFMTQRKSNTNPSLGAPKKKSCGKLARPSSESRGVMRLCAFSTHCQKHSLKGIFLACSHAFKPKQ